MTLIYVEAGAQAFISGHIGFSTQGGKEKNGSVTVDQPSTTSFNFSPAIGYDIDEKISVGLAVSSSMTKNVTPGQTEIIQKSKAFGFAPFLRYYALRLDRFSVFGEASLGFSSSSSLTKGGGVTVDGPKTSTFAAGVVPGVEFRINDQFALQTAINVLSFQFARHSETDGNEKDISTIFNFGAGLDNVASTNAIHIGAIYRF